ncbi:hypothetical protein HMPREF3192_00415 [Atopobium deltae]|uniref:Uncharacterized protein n=1 Tax=Atopobium deltae TaxID=1393034 RepID=A0A133XWL2_9ACTN|nr:hypothetical protein HMPREF3192_00415 [Atopobium deltae]
MEGSPWRGVVLRLWLEAALLLDGLLGTSSTVRGAAQYSHLIIYKQTLISCQKAFILEIKED